MAKERRETDGSVKPADIIVESVQLRPMWRARKEWRQPKLSKNNPNGNISEYIETETSVREEKLRKSIAKSSNSRVRSFGAFQSSKGGSSSNHDFR